jgi:integrase
MTGEAALKTLPNLPPKRLAAWMKNPGLPITGCRYEVRDIATQGHVLRVGAGGGVTFWFYYGRGKKVKLGTLGTITIAQARAAAGAQAAEVQAGHDPATERRDAKAEAKQAATRTLEAFLTNKYAPRYLSHAKTGAATEDRLRFAWAPFLDKDMAAITPAAADLHRVKRLKAGRAPTTLNRDRVALLSLLNKAVEWDVLDANPLTRWKPLPVPKDDAERVRYLMPGERQRLLSALEHRATPQYLRDLTLVALNTGLRRGELFGLTWDDIDFSAKQLTVRAANTKTASTRRVQLNATALGVFKDRKAVTNAIPHPAMLVFTSPITGKRLDNIKKGWAGLMMRAGIEDFRFHDCRHDFASQLVMREVDVYTVQRLMGHSDISMTQRYAHLAPGHLQNAVEALD